MYYKAVFLTCFMFPFNESVVSPSSLYLLNRICNKKTCYFLIIQLVNFKYRIRYKVLHIMCYTYTNCDTIVMWSSVLQFYCVANLPKIYHNYSFTEYLQVNLLMSYIYVINQN